MECMGRITWRKPCTEKRQELIDTIERYTDGEIFTMQMEEIVKTLSAARAPKKDGKRESICRDDCIICRHGMQCGQHRGKPLQEHSVKKKHKMIR